MAAGARITRGVIATLVDYGHRIGLRAWVAAREHDREVDGTKLADRLADDERRVDLPLVIRAPAEALGQVDALWYVRGRLAFLFEVEWTAMVGDAILRRGREIPVGEQQARFLAIPAERAELLRLKLARSPWLRGGDGAPELARPQMAAPRHAGCAGGRAHGVAGAGAGAPTPLTPSAAGAAHHVSVSEFPLAREVSEA